MKGEAESWFTSAMPFPARISFGPLPVVVNLTDFTGTRGVVPVPECSGDMNRIIEVYEFRGKRPNTRPAARPGPSSTSRLGCGYDRGWFDSLNPFPRPLATSSPDPPIAEIREFHLVKRGAAAIFGTARREAPKYDLGDYPGIRSR